MKNRILQEFKSFIIVVSIFLLTGCESYVKNETERYLSGFFITLLIGVVGLIIMVFSKKKEK